MKIYLAGGMKNAWRREFKAIDKHEWLDPCDHMLENEAEYTAADLLAVRQCDLLIAYFSADNPGGYGLSIEMGYAKALGKMIAFIDAKSQFNPEFARRLGMNRAISDVVFVNIESCLEWAGKLL